MVGMFLSQDMARQLNVLLICFCIGECCAGVVTRNFKQNDIFRIAEELAEVEIAVPSSHQKMHENATLGKADELNSLKLSSFNSSGLSNLNATINSSVLDSRNSSITATPPPESLNFPGNASKESDISNQLSADFDQLEKGNMNGVKLDGSNNSTLARVSNETKSAFTNVEFPSSIVSEVASDDIADNGIIGDESSFGEVSNQTKGLNETESRVEEFKVRLNGSDSNASSSLPRNEAESNHDMNFSGDISDGVEEINGSLGSNIDIDNVESGILGEVENLSDVNASEGIFSNLGFEFFRNSEVAKNAAKAMEVFNFTDSLTDHIIEENEFHSFLDVVMPTPEDGDGSNSGQITVVQELFNSSDVNLNGSESVKEFEMFEDKNSTTNITELVEIKNETPNFLNSTELENVDEPLELTNVTEHTGDMNGTLISNLSTVTNETDFAEFGNETLDTKLENVTESLELTNFTEPMEKINETSISNMSSLTNETDFTEVALTEVDSNNSTNAVHKCPPPGICLFWFLSQDACAVNSHCLGSRICCRIRCSKTCIEV